MHYSEVEFSPEDEPFFKYAHDNDLGDFKVDPITNLTTFEITAPEMVKLVEQDLIFDGSAGGLVSGEEKNTEDGIFLLIPRRANRYEYLGVIQPGDYISSPYAYTHFKKRFHQLESSIDNFLNFSPNELNLPVGCQIIDTEDKPISFILLAEYDQFLFSKVTVAAHLDEIVELDNVDLGADPYK